MAELNQTLVIITSTGQEVPLPGMVLSPEDFRTSIGGEIPGISAMTATVNDNHDTGVRTITFNQPEGEKGAWVDPEDEDGGDEDEDIVQ